MPGAMSFGAQGDAGLLQRLGAGSYAFRVMAGTAVLAQGIFTVSP